MLAHSITLKPLIIVAVTKISQNNLLIISNIYNGGQKCWDLSSDITKTSDPSPPTPNLGTESYGTIAWKGFFTQSQVLLSTIVGII